MPVVKLIPPPPPKTVINIEGLTDIEYRVILRALKRSGYDTARYENGASITVGLYNTLSAQRSE